jgi:ribokinase
MSEDATTGTPRVTVVGSVNVDLVVRCSELPRPGETITGRSLERFPGGKGANQAVASRRLGAATRLVACVGDDALAAEALVEVVAAGVDTSGVLSRPGATGVATILVADDGENEIIVLAGANNLLQPQDLALGDHDAVVCQLEIPIEVVAAAAERTRGLFCLNAAPARPLPAALRERADVIVVNRHERDALEGGTTGLLAVTLGAEGAILLEDGRELARARPPRVEAVDTTAAGDAFCAAFVVGMLEGRRGEELLLRACAAGALATTRPGAQPSLPTAAELDALLAGAS